MAWINPIRPPQPGSVSTRDTTPVVLTTGATPLTIAVTAGVPGAQVTLPTRDLMNELRVPIEITEICVGLDSTAGIGNFLNFYTELNLMAGRYPITFGFCPVVALALDRDSDPQEDTIGVVVDAAHIRWVLPRPLILAPNEGFSGAFRISPNRTPLGGGFDSTLNCSLVARGKRMPSGTRVPRVRAVPHASGHLYRMGDGTDNNRASPDTTFKNMHQSTLHVSSINIRNVSAGATQLGANHGLATINGPGGLANTALRQVLSNARSEVGFSQRAALEIPHAMNPGEAYSIALGAQDAASLVDVAVALIGWREE